MAVRKLFGFLATLFFYGLLSFIFILFALLGDILTATAVTISIFIAFVIMFSGVLNEDANVQVNEIQENNANDDLTNENKELSNG